MSSSPPTHTPPHGDADGLQHGPPPGYVAIQRNDLYQAALEGRTWHMLGSVSAGEYVSGFYPDVSANGASQSATAHASSRRRPNPLLSGLSLQKPALPATGSRAASSVRLRSQGDSDVLPAAGSRTASSVRLPSQGDSDVLPAAGARAASSVRLPSKGDSDLALKEQVEDGAAPEPAANAEEANVLGTELSQSGDYEAALQRFSEALARSPDPDLRAVALTNRSVVYSRLMRFREALRDAETCIKLDPGFARGFAAKAAALTGMGRSQEATEALEKAVQLDPSNEETKLNLQLEKARVPVNVRQYLQRLEQAPPPDAPQSGQDLYSSASKSVGAAGKAMSVISAMEERIPGPRKLIVESVIVENLPGDVFGRCKPFLIVSVGNAELTTRVLNTYGGEDIVGSLEKIGFEPGVPCHKGAVWDKPMEFQFQKGVDLVLTVQVMEAERFGWDGVTGVARFSIKDFSHGVKEQTSVLRKDSTPVRSHDGTQQAHVRILARVPADVEDGPVGIGVCFIQQDGNIVVDSLASNYRRWGGVDAKHGDKVLAIEGVGVQDSGFAQIVSLTMGPLGSSCSLQLERGDSKEVVECVVERCALDVPEPDFDKADALTDEEQLAMLMPVQVRSLFLHAYTPGQAGACLPI